MFSIKNILVALFVAPQLILVTANGNFERCKMGNNTCILDTINNKVFRNGANGISDINLSPLEPLRVKTLSIEQGGSSSVRIKLYFENIAYHGFTGAKVLKIKMPSEKIDGEKFNMDLKAPRITQIGLYKIDGSVLFLPIYGQGPSNMTFVDPTLKFRSVAKSYEKNGEKYLQVENAKMKIDTSRLYMDYANLFNSNKQMSDRMNRFLNNNWNVIYGEVRNSVENAFMDVVKNVINDVFKAAPYRQMFTVSK